MTSLLEPVAAGIAVAIFNKYIINKLDPFGWCYNHLLREGGGRLHQLFHHLRDKRHLSRASLLKLNQPCTITYLKTSRIFYLKI